MRFANIATNLTKDYSVVAEWVGVLTKDQTTYSQRAFRALVHRTHDWMDQSRRGPPADEVKDILQSIVLPEFQ